MSTASPTTEEPATLGVAKATIATSLPVSPATTFSVLSYDALADAVVWLACLMYWDYSAFLEQGTTNTATKNASKRTLTALAMNACAFIWPFQNHHHGGIVDAPSLAAYTATMHGH